MNSTPNKPTPQFSYFREDELEAPPEYGSEMTWKSWLGWAGLLALITLLMAVPMLAGKQLKPLFWDDLNITENPALQHWRGIWPIWRLPHQAFEQFSPLGYTLWLLEAQLPRWIRQFVPVFPAPELFRMAHLTSLALHLGNALLLWTLLRKLEIRGAWVAAALFLAHPLQAQTVGWASQQPMLLATFLLLCGLIVYLRFCGVNPLPYDEYARLRLPRTPWVLYAMSLLLMILAILAHPWMAVFPLAVLVIVWWERGGILRGDLRPLMPMFGLTLLTIIGAVLVILRHGRHTPGEQELTLVQYLAASGRAIWTYIFMLIYPAPPWMPAFAYPKWDMSRLAWLQLLWPLSVVVAAGLIWRYRGRLGRPIVAGAGLTFIALLPACVYFNFTSLRDAFVSDSSAYLAVAVLSAGVSSVLSERLSVVPATIRQPGACVALVVLTGLTLYSGWLMRDYRDPGKLWEANLVRYPDATFARVGMASMQLNSGKRDEAARNLNFVLTRDPNHRQALLMMGGILQQEGQFDKALGNYHRLLARDATDMDALLQIAQCHLALGDHAQAGRDCRRVLEIQPGNVDAITTLGFIAAQRGDVDEALRLYSHAIDLDPRAIGPRLNRANLNFSRGDIQLAEADIEAINAINPSSYLPWFNAAGMCASMGLYDMAETFYQEAIGRAPEEALPAFNLGKLMFLLQRYEEAVFWFRRACELAPNKPEYDEFLARAMTLQQASPTQGSGRGR